MDARSPRNLNQRGRLTFLLKDSILYGSAAAISKAIALITLPLLVRQFSVVEYGVFDYFLVLAGVLTNLFIFGQDSAFYRFFFEYEDAAERRQTITQSLLVQLAGVVLLMPLLWFGAEWLTALLIKAPDQMLLIEIVLMQLPFALLINFSQIILKCTFDRARFLVMSLGFAAVHAALLLIAVWVFDVGLQGVLIVGFISSVVFATLGIFFVRQWLAKPKDFRRLLEMLSYAAPYGVIAVLGSLSPMLERTLINNLLGGEDLGIYAMASKIAMLIGLLVLAFQTAWSPFWFSLHKQADMSDTYNWVLKVFALVMCLTALGFTLLAHPLIYFLATSLYSSAVIVVFPLVMGLAIQATSEITGIGIAISKRSHLNLYSYSAAITTTVIGIWLLVPVFGLFGVGLGVLVGHLVKSLVSSWLAQRAYPLPWPYIPVILLMATTLALGLGAIWLGERFGPLFRNLALVASLLIVLLVGWCLLLNRGERARVFVLVAGRIHLCSPRM
jgi:O-antigen/teichoic acid export membrane protein